VVQVGRDLPGAPLVVGQQPAAPLRDQHGARRGEGHVPRELEVVHDDLDVQDGRVRRSAQAVAGGRGPGARGAGGQQQHGHRAHEPPADAHGGNLLRTPPDRARRIGASCPGRGTARIGGAPVDHAPAGHARLILLGAVAPVVWGTTYVVTTELLPPDRPMTASLLRALPAGLLLLALTRQLPPRAWWGRFA